MRKGWFVIPGVQDGYVTFEEQITGLQFALAECSGKSVLDVGCAEGLIGREFAKAGAAQVTCLDSVPEHLEVAKQQCNGYPMTFELANINYQQPDYSSDIVLALAVIHKLRVPEVGVRFAAKSSRCLVVYRSARDASAGIVTGKHSRITCDSHAVMREEGFTLERVVDGPRMEAVEYWRRA